MMKHFLLFFLLAVSLMSRASCSKSSSHSPTADGKYLVQSSIDAATEFSKNVPMLIGTNLNEFPYNNRAIITTQPIDQVNAIVSHMSCNITCISINA